MDYKKRLDELKKEAGLTFAGYSNGGAEMWIGTDKEWEKAEMLERILEEEYNDPPEGSPFHPENGKEFISRDTKPEDIPF